MVDIRAKWGNILYEEALRDVAEVSIPKTTMETIMTTDLPTPGTTTTKTKTAIPSIIKPTVFETATEFVSTGLEALIGSREDKVTGVSQFIPAEIETTTTPPIDYNIDLVSEQVKTAIGKIPITTVEYPSSVKDTPSGRVEQLYIEDIKTATETQDFDKYIQEMIDIQKETIEGAKEFWEQNVLGSTDIDLPKIEIPEIKLPDLTGWLGELGKYALLIGGGLIAILLLTRK